MKNKKIDQKLKRKEQVEQGAYDGRYKEKVVPNKKKKENKELARKKITTSYVDKDGRAYFKHTGRYNEIKKYQ